VAKLAITYQPEGNGQAGAIVSVRGAVPFRPFEVLPWVLRVAIPGVPPAELWFLTDIIRGQGRRYLFDPDKLPAAAQLPMRRELAERGRLVVDTPVRWAAFVAAITDSQGEPFPEPTIWAGQIPNRQPATGGRPFSALLDDRGTEETRLRRRIRERQKERQAILDADNYDIRDTLWALRSIEMVAQLPPGPEQDSFQEAADAAIEEVNKRGAKRPGFTQRLLDLAGEDATDDPLLSAESARLAALGYGIDDD